MGMVSGTESENAVETIELNFFGFLAYTVCILVVVFGNLRRYPYITSLLPLLEFAVNNYLNTRGLAMVIVFEIVSYRW